MVGSTLEDNTGWTQCLPPVTGSKHTRAPHSCPTFGLQNFLDVGEMAQRLRALTVLPEDLSLMTSTHMLFYNHLELQFQGIQRHLLTSLDTRRANVAHTYKAGKHTPIKK